MTTNKIQYETGATSHAVNDLILFTDNTRDLAEERDSIFQYHVDKGYTIFPHSMLPLFTKAARYYAKEFKNSHDHIKNMHPLDIEEYCTLYAVDFPTWKKEHGY